MSGTRIRGAVSGLLAGAAGLGVAQLFAGLVRPEAGPMVAVGGTVVDAAPTPVKEFAVRQFGTHDKLILTVSVAAAVAAFAVGVGILAARHRRVGLAGAGVLGVVGVAAALSRPAASPIDALPAGAGGLAAVAALALLHGSARAASPGSPGRRAFLRTSGLVALAAAATASGGVALLDARAARAARLRTRVRLPAPVDTAGPANTTPGFYTSAADFYRVDTALSVPRIDPSQWRLRIHGLVERPVSLDFTELSARRTFERDITLNCVSNEVGGPYIGTARWLGVPLAPLLREAGIRPGAEQVVARSVDGMTIGTALATVLDGRDTMLAIGMNGQPLPLEHGFPARMLTPGVYGYAGACKWVVDLELATFAGHDPYWVRRGWASRAPVKTGSRIDRPAPLSTVGRGWTRVAGVAWAQHRGIVAVEIQIDDAPWHPARILPSSSVDTWVRWVYDWPATPGEHRLRVRATDGTRAVQTDRRAPTFPDGATGWHTIAVTVT